MQRGRRQGVCWQQGAAHTAGAANATAQQAQHALRSSPWHPHAPPGCQGAAVCRKGRPAHAARRGGAAANAAQSRLRCSRRNRCPPVDAPTLRLQGDWTGEFVQQEGLRMGGAGPWLALVASGEPRYAGAASLKLVKLATVTSEASHCRQRLFVKRISEILGQRTQEKISRGKPSVRKEHAMRKRRGKALCTGVLASHMWLSNGSSAGVHSCNKLAT